MRSLRHIPAPAAGAIGLAVVAAVFLVLAATARSPASGVGSELNLPEKTRPLILVPLPRP